jgi:hypothetical protein
MYNQTRYMDSSHCFKDGTVYPESVYSDKSDNSDRGSVGGLSTVSDLEKASYSELLPPEEDRASGPDPTTKKNSTMNRWLRTIQRKVHSMPCGESYGTDSDPSRVVRGASRNSSASAAPSRRASWSEKHDVMGKRTLWSKAKSLRSNLKDRYRAWTMTPEECPLRRSPMVNY